MLYTLGALVIIGLLSPAMWSWFERKMVFVPSRSSHWTPALSRWTFEEVWLTASDGVKLHGWFMPGESGSIRKGLGVLILHGNGGNISHRAPLYDLLRREGLDVLAVDYRGYGRSRGTPSEEGTYRDAEAAWAWWLARGYRAERILLLGESLGGAVATELAVRHPPGGLILQSTFTSIPDMARALMPWVPQRWIRTRYDTLAKAPGLRCPLLVLHGRDDTLVPFAHAERLFAAAPEPKWLRELEGDHNDALATPQGVERYAAAVREFVERIASSRATDPTDPTGRPGRPDLREPPERGAGGRETPH